MKQFRPAAPSILPSDYSTVRFGGGFFLDQLLTGIEYDPVLDQIQTGLHDRIHALLMYYLLTNTADMHADVWYDNNYTKYLYPNANLYSQRISELYEKIGADSVRVGFLEKHIEYVLKSTDDECCILLDSTGCQNACSVPITRVSRHENDVNVEFRVILVVQRSTGLPLYYQIIKGNVVDVSTLDHTKSMLSALGLKVTHVLGDAGYSCPSNMERLTLAGIGLMMRLNPTYNLYKDALGANLERFYAAGDPDIKEVTYRNRVIKVLKVSTVIGVEKENGTEHTGFIYLCQDIEAHHTKSAQLYRSNKDRKGKALTQAELKEKSRKLGLFAIVSAEDMSEEDVLPAYYMRQGVEQYFDYAKNYGKMMPVRNHTPETISGHMLMSFIATFVCVLIKNRMNLMDTRYCAVPSHLREKVSPEETVFLAEETDGVKKEYVLVQDPLKEVFESSPGELFMELELVNAIHFPKNERLKREEQLIPDPQHKDAREFLEAFGLVFPDRIVVDSGSRLNPLYEKGQKATCSRAKAFTVRASISDEKIEAVRKARDEKKLADLQQKLGSQAAPAPVEEAPPKRKGGRPKGSLNKKTLKRLAEEKAKQEAGLPSTKTEKRKAGRPKGSLNKKTIARMAEEKRLKEAGLAADAPKRKRGRPKGSLNRKTLEKLANQGMTQE